MSDPRFQDQIYSAGFVDGIANEQSRIIKLLEEHAISAAYASKKPEKEPYVLAWWDAVALIKGENE